MCCTNDDTHFFPLEECVSDLLSSLLIRNMSEEQMKVKIKAFFIRRENEDSEVEIKESLKKIFMNTQAKHNPNIDFQNLFIDKLFEKAQNLNTKNIMIASYPLLNNKKNLMADNFFNLLKEKLGAEFDYEAMETMLFYVIKFYTHDLTKMLVENLEEESQKKIGIEILDTKYSLTNINNFVAFAMTKDHLVSSGLWNTPVTFERARPIFKAIEIDDYLKIRNNLNYYDR